MEITNEKYQNIINMMCSEDDENKLVALSIINELDYTNNITKILLLKKHSTTADLLFEFYMKDFSMYLLKQVKSMGYDYIEDMQLTIKYKEHEQNREPSESV